MPHKIIKCEKRNNSVKNIDSNELESSIGLYHFRVRFLGLQVTRQIYKKRSVARGGPVR